MTLKGKKILFTGGGSAGHVTPNIALIEKFREANWQVAYIGSHEGVEKQLITQMGIPYYPIYCDKLRRYFSWRNFLSPFRVLYGIVQAAWRCYREKPAIVFSKGGFVAFPVVVGAWINGIPVVAHESDFTPGFSNRLTFPFVKTICVTFPETAELLKHKNKVVVTGTPIRKGFFTGDAERGRRFCGFSTDKKILLVYGGGLGATAINRVIHASLSHLLEMFQIAHVCGQGKMRSAFNDISGYVQYEYLHDALYDVMACADVVLSRAGANSIYELLALRKPHLLVPLSQRVSRGDQVMNARYCEEKGFSTVLQEEVFDESSLLKSLRDIVTQEEHIKQRLTVFLVPDAVSEIYRLLTTDLITQQYF